MDKKMIFVYDTNLKGIETKGSSQVAREKFEADSNITNGPSGRAYAIPTKDKNLSILNLDKIMTYVEEFKNYARANPDSTFLVTKIGTGYLGHYDQAMASLFKGSPKNCKFHFTWEQYLSNDIEYEYYSKLPIS